MSAVQTRAEVRKELKQAFEVALEQVVPEDEAQPLRGQTFLDFEEQVWEAGRKVLAQMVERRAALDRAAWVEQGGRCPHCGSERVYLELGHRVKQFLSPCGPITVRLQDCRCRKCGGSFSPSGARLGAAERSAADTARAATSDAGRGDPNP